MGRHRTHVTETIQGDPNSRGILVAGAQSVLEATAARIRNEVASLDGDLLDEKLLLMQQIDHLDAALSLLERVLPAGSDAAVKLCPEMLCEACRHLNMSVHTMLALAPKFREAICHRLSKQLGTCLSSRFDCFLRRRTPVEMSPEKRKSRLRVQLEKLEKQHEDCLLDLLLSLEHLTTLEVVPPPDAPARCAEGCRYVLSGQAKLHQSHAMVCQLLVEEDDLLLPILEWQLGAAASDFAVARAVLDRLPRPKARRAKAKIESHSPPQATVNVRCESKAQIVSCPVQRESSMRLDESFPNPSPREPRSRSLLSPVTAPRRNTDQRRGNGYTLQEPAAPATSPRKIYDTSTLQSDCLYSCGNSRPRSPASSSVPNLGALGPCDLCSSGTAFRQKYSPTSDRYNYMGTDCPVRTGGRVSPFDSRVADYASWGSVVGSDYRRR
ncbi:hypothetical protein, conserved [Eimeria tenella]|uniref:Uncharacterized protein n=1 Tax=Eimeria tenella TaxID=5802 RepID=U6L4V1_EIMTE|nr:hypothetical protein, conserved [Eimeria tenella]CDJ42805.1 hypothetical protein, conserved [Eimeria tenella]|eukprot:XP_013233555.1 hypothetical protein, conserved [Eimeria tenella]